MRSKKVIFGFILLFTCFLTQHVVHANEAIINTENLNVRNGPGMDFDTINQVNQGEVYEIMEQQDNWVKIKLTNSTGWITTEYITIKDISKPKKITILHENTQIRNGPATDYDIIKYVPAGTTFEVVSETDGWYQINNQSFEGYVYKNLIDQKNTISYNSLSDKTIVIDAGHGGRDVGAIGVNNSLEKDLTFQTALELKQELSLLGADVILTRNDDEYISLNGRSSLSNVLDTDAFISLHYNSTNELPNVTGVGTYYYHNHDRDLAMFIQDELVKEAKAKDRGMAFGDFQVIRLNVKPSVLIELGFISNPEKEKLLQTSTYQKKLVRGIIYGLEKYFNELET